MKRCKKNIHRISQKVNLNLTKVQKVLKFQLDIVRSKAYLMSTSDVILFFINFNSLITLILGSTVLPTLTGNNLRAKQSTE